MDSPPLPLAETRERRCPYCGNRAVVGMGHVTASATGIRCDYRCPSCSTEFVLLFSMRLIDPTEGTCPSFAAPVACAGWL